MLPRRARLSTEEFNAVMEKGRVLHSPLFLVRVFPAKDRAAFAAVAPKKVAKTAVVRNKIRRQIYSALESVMETGTFSPVHALIFAKETANGRDREHRTAVLREIFVKAGIIK